MTKTLTEQWSEGTLPEGLYYVEGKGDYDVALIRNRYCPVLTSPYCEDDVFESEFVPVAPVPSYEEVKQFVDVSKKVKELEKRLEVSEKEHYRTLEQLRIATGALRETRKKLLRVELSGLDGDDRQKMYDLMFEDGVIDKALKEMEGVK